MLDKMPTKADADKLLASLPITLKVLFWMEAIKIGLKAHPVVSTGLTAVFLMNLFLVQDIAFKIVGLLVTVFFIRSLLKPIYLRTIARDLAKLSEEFK